MIERDPVTLTPFIGSLLLASALGLATGYWCWSGIVLVALLSLAFDEDESRPEPRN